MSTKPNPRILLEEMELDYTNNITNQQHQSSSTNRRRISVYSNPDIGLLDRTRHLTNSRDRRYSNIEGRTIQHINPSSSRRSILLGDDYRRHSEPEGTYTTKTGNRMEDLLAPPSTTSRRSTIFSIAENFEFEHEDFQRRLSNCLKSYSSDSSLESDIGESWTSRARRRISVIPKSMGLQPWVKSSGPLTSTANGRRKAYEDIKDLINNGKINEAKGAVRDGDWDVGDDIRSRLWPLLASVHQSTHTTGDYWELVKEIFGHGPNDIPENSIGLPGACSSETAFYYKLDERGISYCNRICSVLIYSYPDITYANWLCPITALFLHYVDEEKTYSCVGNLLKAVNKVFMTQTKLQADASALVAMALTKKFSKSTYSTLVNHLVNESMESIFESWSFWIFRDLPIPHLVRVMDCFLMEGVKVLYRIAIGLLNHLAKSEISENNSLQSFISQHTQYLQLTPARLLKKGFSIRNFRSTEIKTVTVKTTFEIKNSKVPRSTSAESIHQPARPIDISSCSKTLTDKELYNIWQWLPIRITMHEPQLIYTTDEDGCSLTNFFNKVEHYEPILLVLKTISGEVFGGYCSSAWIVRNEKDERGERQRYFGTGETFLFTLYPEKKKYPWVGIKGKVEHAAELFMHASNNVIAIGGGEGTGIQIDADLRYGKTEHCLTFDNEPLVQSRDFEVQLLEAFAFLLV